MIQLNGNEYTTSKNDTVTHTTSTDNLVAASDLKDDLSLDKISKKSL